VCTCTESNILLDLLCKKYQYESYFHNKGFSDNVVLWSWFVKIRLDINRSHNDDVINITRHVVNDEYGDDGDDEDGGPMSCCCTF